MPKVKALDSFSHDSINAKRGDVFNLPLSVAQELEKHNLVKLAEQKSAPEDRDKKVQTSAQNKAKTAASGLVASVKSLLGNGNSGQ